MNELVSENRSVMQELEVHQAFQISREWGKPMENENCYYCRKTIHFQADFQADVRKLSRGGLR